MHADALAVDAALARRLLAEQLPAWADLPLAPLPHAGSTNALFRLGEDLLVRLPRQPGSGAAITKESRWAGAVAAALPVPVPEVVAVGAPTADYPEAWSVLRRLEGTRPGAGTGGPVLAADLAAVVTALRDAPVPPAATADPALRSYRAEPLAAFDESFRHWLDQCRVMPQRGLDLDLDLDRAGRVWREAAHLPAPPDPTGPHWAHGDLLAENLLTADGRLTAVLDLGSLAVGDPAIDLIAAWEALDGAGRAVFREAVAVDEPTWLRGRAWALAVALMTFPYYWHSLPSRCADRLVMAHAVLAD